MNQALRGYLPIIGKIFIYDQSWMKRDRFFDLVTSGTPFSEQKIQQMPRIVTSLTLSIACFATAGCSVVQEPAVSEAIACARHDSNQSAPKLGELLAHDSNHVMIVAHRGCWRETAENSLASIKSCVEAGVDMVELDVRRTADGELVLIHDETVDRTTSGKGEVGALSLAEVTALRLQPGAGNYDGELLDETVPTLEQALIEAKGKILINIDAKDDVIEQALALVSELGMNDQVVFKARLSPDEIEGTPTPLGGQGHFMPILRESDSKQPLSERIEPFLSTKPVAFEVVFDSEGYILEGAAALDNAQQRIWANTMLPKYSAGLDDASAIATPDKVWGALLGQGVDMIQTDNPIEAISYLDSIGRRCSSVDAVK